jgi:DegV family protein with EDD domain
MAEIETATDAAGVCVVTDSAASLPPGEAAARGIVVVPMTLVIGDRTYTDEPLAADDEVLRLLARGVVARTSAPPPAAFLAAFRAAPARDVLCLTVGSEFSASCANAMAAAREAETEGRRVRVLDSGVAAMAQGYAALAAAEAAAAGAPLEEAAAAATHAGRRAGLVMLLEGLEHLARGGRVPRVAAWATSLLQVRPLVEFGEGRIRLAGRVRARRRGLEELLSALERRLRGARASHVCVQHAGAVEDAEWLRGQAEARLRWASLRLSPFSRVMAAHVGPGLVGFAYLVEE